ncbi:MAG TPA: replicative DNA helicase [Dehalococcoidia bacterium]|nr:replicative DNA helicase [Dehalococcoidia bacterium]
MASDQLLPHDVDAEEAVLGSMLIDSEAIISVSLSLKAQDFYRERNAWVYGACLALYEKGEAINQITAAHRLSQDGRLDDVGGPAYLSYLVSRVPTPFHAEHYGEIVHRTAFMRRLIDAGGRIAAVGYEARDDVETALSRAEDVLFGLSSGRPQRDLVHIRQLLDRYFEETGLGGPPPDGHLAHIETGFIDLDKLLGGGFQRSDLVILAARPSLGKTSLALNVAQHAAIKLGARVAIFSLEMSKEQVVQRLLCSQARVDSQRLRQGSLNQEEARRIMEATGVLSEAPIYVDDSPIIKIVEIRSKARRLHNEIGVDLVIVDYLGLVHGGNFENRVQEISYISRSLKALARELEAPVLAVSQLSRAVETRSPHTPQLSDLRDSGSIEQDADVVLFIYRDDVYYTEEEWARKSRDPYPKGIAEVRLAKHRNGPVGELKIRFNESSARFDNLATEAGRPPRRDGPARVH